MHLTAGNARDLAIAPLPPTGVPLSVPEVRRGLRMRGLSLFPVAVGKAAHRPARGYARLSNDVSTGNARIRVPVALKIALQIAADVGGTPGSPTPPGGASLGTI